MNERCISHGAKWMKMYRVCLVYLDGDGSKVNVEDDEGVAESGSGVVTSKMRPNNKFGR